MRSLTSIFYRDCRKWTTTMNQLLLRILITGLNKIHSELTVLHSDKLIDGDEDPSPTISTSSPVSEVLKCLVQNQIDT